MSRKPYARVNLLYFQVARTRVFLGVQWYLLGLLSSLPTDQTIKEYPIDDNWLCIIMIIAINAYSKFTLTWIPC